jgi:hypothetical protein
MLAVNVKGTSNASISTDFFRTKADIPSDVPTTLLAQAINASAIRLRWMVGLFYRACTRVSYCCSQLQAVDGMLHLHQTKIEATY